MAIRLDKAFGGDANTWYSLPAAYDLAQAMKEADRIMVRAAADSGVEVLSGDRCAMPGPPVMLVGIG